MLHTTGVTNSVNRVRDHLLAGGHEVRVIAPGSAGEEAGAATTLLRSFALPSYPDVRLTAARAKTLEAILRDFVPDVVHLASPFVLGWQCLRAADHLGIPTVAIYQTDIPGYAQRYGIPLAAPALAQHVARIHKRATLTLAPSSSAVTELTGLGVTSLRLWARGVDGQRYRPERRTAAWRRRHAPGGETIIGYVGRLAPEKQVEDLRAVADLPGTRLVIVGDGPSRPALERMLPDATFLGFQSGDELAESYAGFDVFVHPGENETFCQTVQEALASGVPVVATGRGGPLDLVQNSRTGWLYTPGDLDELRARVLDLTGDHAKRRAFARAARDSVAHRTWSSLGDELLGHYRHAIALKSGRLAVPADATQRPARWSRYVAIGDSITEGLCDDSRQAAGEYRGWADRLALLLSHTAGRPSPLLYANLAVRSRTVPDVLDRQIPRALELGADLVTILIGGNDLAGPRPTTRRMSRRLADRLHPGVARLRAAGCEVLLIAPFVPPNPFLRTLHRRAAGLAPELARVGAVTGARVLDLTGEPGWLEPRMWSDDRVHLSSHGHRMLAYRVAAALGMPGAQELGELDVAVHDEPIGEQLTTPRWVWRHVRPWLGRRLRGQTAGDGRQPKHHALVPVIPADPSGHPATIDR